MSKADKNKSPSASELLGMETALMISTAPARNIDVSIWFNEKSSGKGKMNQRDFDARIVSLAATMSINQDAETKKELELAVSPLALRMIHSLCTVGEDENRLPIIDVTYFFQLCDERVSRYLEEIESNEIKDHHEILEEKHDVQTSENFRNWVAGEYDIEGNLLRSDLTNSTPMMNRSESQSGEKVQIFYQNNFQRHSADYSETKVSGGEDNLHEDDDDFVHFQAEEYINDIREKALAPRPKSAPSGRRGNERGETTGQVLQYSKDDHQLEPSVAVTSSEAKEEIANNHKKPRTGKSQPFDIQATDIPIPRKTGATPPPPKTSSSVEKKHAQLMAKSWHEENRAYLTASEAKLSQPPPTSHKSPATPANKTKPAATTPNNNSNNPSSSKPRPVSVDRAKARPTSAPKTRTTTPPPAAARNKRATTTPPAATTTANKRAVTASPGNKRRKEAVPSKMISENDLKDLLYEEAWKQQLRDDPLSFIFPKSASPENDHDNEASSDPRRRNSFSGFMRGSLKPRSQPVFHSTSHLKPSQLTEEEVDRLKDVVEDLVREVVKKTDLYHRLQVSLGYVPDYVLIPPRGEIIQSNKGRKDWVSDRDLHTAFLAARLFLNEQQLWVLKRLVTDFSGIYKRLYQEKVERLIRLKEDLEEEEKLPRSVKGPGNCLSNLWLKKYLLHLRLTKRDRSNQAITAQEEGIIDKELAEIATHSLPCDPTTAEKDSKEDQEDNGGEKKTSTTTTTTTSPSPHISHKKDKENKKEEKTPVPWKEWLARKLQAEMTKGPSKPKEFTRILSGNPNTTLSKEEIDLYLKHHSILPEEALLQEIEYRIEAWILDIDGRRDFQHQLNMKTRAYIWEELILHGKPPTAQSSLKIPASEKHYWQRFYQLSGEERERVKTAIVTKLIAEKREAFKSGERLQKEVTKSLFWQFFQFVKDRERGGSLDCSWNQWLLDHLEKLGRSLDKYKQEKLVQRQQSQHQSQRKKALAPLVSLEKSLKSISSHLDHYHQLQLQKGIIHLRRLAKEKGLGNGEVVTKEDFDHHIKSILVPYISLDETILVEEDTENLDLQTKPNLVAKEWKEKISKLFTLDSEQTLQQVLEDHQKDDIKNKISFEKWIADKNKEKEEKAREEELAKEAKIREEEIKKKNSEKAYKKWLRLRRKNK